MEVIMSDNIQRTPIQIAWINFTKSVQVLLGPQTDDRPLDQYLSFRDAVLTLVQNEQFLKGLNEAWESFTADTPPLTEIRDALLLELQAFPLAVEVAKGTEKPEEAKGWRSKMLGQASMVSGSVKDLLQNLPPYVKSGLTLFEELIDLFKGKD
jgi:hypothetical protein